MAKVVQDRPTVTVRTISGHPSGITLPDVQSKNARVRLSDPSTSQGRVLASSQPNTDPRRWVTHS